MDDARRSAVVRYLARKGFNRRPTKNPVMLDAIAERCVRDEDGLGISDAAAIRAARVEVLKLLQHDDLLWQDVAAAVEERAAPQADVPDSDAELKPAAPSPPRFAAPLPPQIEQSEAALAWELYQEAIAQGRGSMVDYTAIAYAALPRDSTPQRRSALARYLRQCASGVPQNAPETGRPWIPPTAKGDKSSGAVLRPYLPDHWTPPGGVEAPELSAPHEESGTGPDRRSRRFSVFLLIEVLGCTCVLLLLAMLLILKLAGFL